MINLPDYAPLVDLGSIIETFDTALRGKTDYAVMLRSVSTVFSGNMVQLWLENKAKKRLPIASLIPEFDVINYPMTMAMRIDSNMLPYDDAEFLEEGAWAIDGDSPTTVVYNPGELEDAINDIFQTEWVTIAICELMAGGKK